MSISTSGGDQRRPSVVNTGKQPAAGAKPGDRSTAKPAAKPVAKGGRPGGANRPGGKGPRKPVAPVKVSQGRNWGPIALFTAVGLLAAGIIGWAGYASFQGAKPWDERAAEIDGIVNYRKQDPTLVKGGVHKAGPLKYAQNPPVAGEHNNNIQNCEGNVYDAPIANEHAVHSLEHGAVWITYRPDLPQDQVAKLKAKVEGVEKTFMSPYTGLDSAVSLQAWGYQLKVPSANDERVDEFIKALRVNASIEGATAPCGGGITATGTTPRDLQPPQQPQPGQPGQPVPPAN